MVGVRADGLHPVYRSTTGVESPNEHSTSACLRNSCVFIQTVSRTNPVSLTHNDTGLNQNHSRLTSRSETNSRSREANLHRGAEIDSYIDKVTLLSSVITMLYHCPTRRDREFVIFPRPVGSNDFFRLPPRGSDASYPHLHSFGIDIFLTSCKTLDLCLEVYKSIFQSLFRGLVRIIQGSEFRPTLAY